jgi:hypothetical protein
MDEEEIDKQITAIYDDFFTEQIDFDSAISRLVELGLERENATSVLASMMTINFNIIDDLESGDQSRG